MGPARVDKARALASTVSAMKLHYAPISPYSWKVLIALYEKNIPFERAPINIMDPEVVAAYTRDINPIGKVPVMDFANGERLSESSIIVERLDIDHDAHPLIPADRKEALAIRRWDRMADAYINDQVAGLFFEGMKPEAARDQGRIAQWRRRLGAMLGIVDKQLENHTFVGGASYTLADIAVQCGSFYAPFTGFDMSPYANVKRWLGQVQQRPSWGRVMEEAKPILESFQH